MVGDAGFRRRRLGVKPQVKAIEDVRIPFPLSLFSSLFRRSPASSESRESIDVNALPQAEGVRS